jgi:hypothetical protein
VGVWGGEIDGGFFVFTSTRGLNMKKLIFIALVSVLSASVCFAQDLSIIDKIKNFHKNNSDISTYIETEVWTSTNPADLKPIMGTKWEFSWGTTTETITFGTKVITTDDGYVGIEATSSRGWWGATAYGDLIQGGRGYFVVYKDSDTLYYYEFIPNSSYTSGSGKFWLADLDTLQPQKSYTLSCEKISGSTSTTTIYSSTTTTVPSGSFECPVNMIDKLEGTLWKYNEGNTYMGFYKGFLYFYYGDTNPERGFIRYGRFIEFGDHMFLMRYGAIIALQINVLGKWNFDANGGSMNTFQTIRIVFLPLPMSEQYKLVCSDWSL